MEVKDILKDEITIIVGKTNSGKSTLLRNMINIIKHNYKAPCEVFSVHPNVNTFFSLLELETIKNSFIFVDEVGSLFDLENRKNKKQIENVLRLVSHNNNKLVLSGLPMDFKRFLTSKASTFIFKSLNKQDLINGSDTKNIINQYKGAGNGMYNFQVPISEALVYNKDDGFYSIAITYDKENDTKKDNVDLFVSKIVPRKIQKTFRKK